MPPRDSKTSITILAADDDRRGADHVAEIGSNGDISFRLVSGEKNVWVIGSMDGVDVLSLRQGFGGSIESKPIVSSTSDGRICEWLTSLGAMRLKISCPPVGGSSIHCLLSFIPTAEVRLAPLSRDLFFTHGAEGCVHTTQRGLRTGLWFATVTSPKHFSVLYLQDFSTLNEFFDLTNTSPSGTVGGDLSEAGYLPPINEQTVLPKAREIIVSDAHLSIVPSALKDDTEIAGRYLDMLADVYQNIERPETAYHKWPEKASRTMRDLTLSPVCTYERQNHRYLMPYVSDTTKPPESMVQLTVLVNALEFDTWLGAESHFTRTQLEGIKQFYNPEIGSIVRWLPGEDFGKRSEENMNHECMDSWYLYHALFNLSRLAARGHASSLEIFRTSLPFAIRVARRFNYTWPIFFDLKTLDIVRAESAPGEGGENDVAGLYALVMLHAHELFDDATFLSEAEKAAESLKNRTFDIGYQMNTTGFAAEAMLRLWQIKHDPSYLKLSEMCIANMFDNMWLWKCEYGHAKNYRTFFGLFPLHDAPYLAAYEELECQAKFHEYLALGGNNIRPSLRLLIAEYQKYSLDRCWFYYPDALPVNVLSNNVRNGTIESTLAIPLEDMQDGRSLCGQVGQEIYGAGLVMIYASRHYAPIPEANIMLFCEYPLYEFRITTRGHKSIVTFRTGGTDRGKCKLRAIPMDPEKDLAAVSVLKINGTKKMALSDSITVEGDFLFTIEGDSKYELQCKALSHAVQAERERRS